ncbi:MAG: hypothetical protein K0R98_149 [Rickettsiaceae bacterium]|jgi:hypothetical protein|nr:hypothetical protein [Rickettsiaceae bacterium]
MAKKKSYTFDIENNLPLLPTANDTKKEPGYIRSFLQNLSHDTQVKIFRGVSLISATTYGLYWAYQFYLANSESIDKTLDSFNSTNSTSHTNTLNLSNTTTIQKRDLEEITYTTSSINIGPVNYAPLTYTPPGNNTGTILVAGDSHLSAKTTVEQYGTSLTDKSGVYHYTVTGIPVQSKVEDIAAIYRTMEQQVGVTSLPNNKNVQVGTFGDAGPVVAKALCSEKDKSINPTSINMQNIFISEAVVPSGQTKLFPAGCNISDNKDSTLTLVSSDKSQKVTNSQRQAFFSNTLDVSGLTNADCKTAEYNTGKVTAYTETTCAKAGHPTIKQIVTHEPKNIGGGYNSQISGGTAFVNVIGYDNISGDPASEPKIWDRLISSVVESTSPTTTPGGNLSPSSSNHPPIPRISTDGELNTKHANFTFPKHTLPAYKEPNPTPAATDSTPSWLWPVVGVSGAILAGGAIFAFVLADKKDAVQNDVSIPVHADTLPVQDRADTSLGGQVPSFAATESLRRASGTHSIV